MGSSGARLGDFLKLLTTILHTKVAKTFGDFLKNITLSVVTSVTTS